MKSKIYILIIIMTLVPNVISAQSNYYYYYKGNKVYLHLDKNFLHISAKYDFQISSISDLNFIASDLKEENVSINGQKNKWLELEFQSEPSETDYFQKINTLKNNNLIDVVQPSFTLPENSERVGLSSFFYVKLKQNSDFSTLQALANNKNVVIVEQNQFMPLWYTLKCTKSTIGSSLEIANYFYETSLFASATPDFITYTDLDCSEDPYFYDSWGLNNTGQNNGTGGIDINICDAWAITEGQGIIIAVLDTGIEESHPDLNGNLYNLNYDTENGTPYQQVWGNHGTACAGIIGAIKDNNEGVVGIAPQAKLMSVSNKLNAEPNSRMKRADGINWAYLNGADIINNSWSSSVQFEAIDDAITNALTDGRYGLGTVIVFSAGNQQYSHLNYPANSNYSIITVGAIDQCGKRKDWNTSCAGEIGWGSNYGEKLDIMAPGVLIPTTDRLNTAGYSPQYEDDPNYNYNYFSKFGKTSAAAPHVTGVAALILSVNPCLNVQQVEDIIEQSAQKVGGYSYTTTAGRANGTWNNEMGYGLVDAYASVQLAQQMHSSTLDLYVKDRPNDMGIEPNPTSDYMWTSEDIWVRNNNDDGLEHQNPEYNSNGQPNYIKIRVINKSCVPSTGTETLTVNWAKANTALAWPQNWDGSLSNDNDFPLGGVVPGCPISLPIIQPGEANVITIPWIIPNPNYYSDNDNPWHFCILATIDNGEDPLSYPYTTNPNEMVRNNNNQAWKNLTVVDAVNEGGIITPGAMVAISNPHNSPRTFYLEIVKEDSEKGKAIYDEAEVTLKMDDILYNAWVRGGKEAVMLENKENEKSKLVKGNNVLLDNIMFNANEYALLQINFNFLTKELTDKNNYTYHIIQKDAITGETIGGETFVINKNARSVFSANADDVETDLNAPITISAEDIYEPAEYNWYDIEGNLIYQGKDLQIANAVVKKYKLEVIATADGFKDYKEVEVKLKPSTLENITPNPTTNNVLVSYKLNGANSAYLMVIGYYGSNGTSNNYILDVNSIETNLNVSNYQSGYYTIALVVNGEIVDAKTLIKN